MRKIGSGRGMVSAYPRQLESLIRLAEAHAKVRFSDKVETIDVEEAKRLHREALKQSATDPRTGFVDISILTTGMIWGDNATRNGVSFHYLHLLFIRDCINTNYKHLIIISKVVGE